MSNHAENRDVDEESDSSDDEDYVPEEDRNQLSEEDSDAAVDEDAHDSETEEGTGRKRKLKGKSKGRKKPKHDAAEEEPSEEQKKLAEEETKKKAEDIWAAFKSDTNFLSTKPPPRKEESSSVSEEVVTNPEKSAVESKAACDKKTEEPKLFEFAGETLVMSGNSDLKPSQPPPSRPQTAGFRRSGGGLSGLMSQLKGKGTKLSTLEKSQMDWNNFKSKEGLTEEIQTHNRGKQGYLERQDFLERADHRQFEIEKQMRATTRKSNR